MEERTFDKAKLQILGVAEPKHDGKEEMPLLND